MNKSVYIWFTDMSILRETWDQSMETVAFVSETIEEGEREFAKRYSDFSAEDYTFTDGRTDMYCWAIKRELINNKEEEV